MSKNLGAAGSQCVSRLPSSWDQTDVPLYPLLVLRLLAALGQGHKLRDLAPRRLAAGPEGGAPRRVAGCAWSSAGIAGYEAVGGHRLDRAIEWTRRRHVGECG